MTWLVTGGAGFIGAHVVRCFLDSGRDVVVLDDLSYGRTAFLAEGVRLVRGSVVDPDAVGAALTSGPSGSPVEGVVHLAGFKFAGVSVEKPLYTYEQNVTGMHVLLGALLRVGVHNMIFSSSAATYGTPEDEIVTEKSPTRPESPYGESKLIGEWLLRDVGRVEPLRHTSLRYFNVVGSGRPDIFDASPHGLFPLVMRALTGGEPPAVFGTDYPTPDGSCVRDYVHVQDVALAHVAAAEALEQGRVLEPAYNLGSGTGLSVLQIMDAVRRVTGIAFEPDLRERRTGDPARIVASGALAARDLGWAMRHSVDDMVASAWQAWQRAEQSGQARGLPSAR